MFEKYRIRRYIICIFYLSTLLSSSGPGIPNQGHSQPYNVENIKINIFATSIPPTSLQQPRDTPLYKFLANIHKFSSTFLMLESKLQFSYKTLRRRNARATIYQP